MKVDNGSFKGLSEQQISAFEILKSLCADAGLLSHPSGLGDEEVEYGLNDDPTLLRFLRARRFNPQGALKQFKDARSTWEANNVSQLYDEIDVASFETARALYPHWSGRRTKSGRPIFIFDFAYLNQAVLSSYEDNRKGSGSSSTQATLQQREASVALDSITRFILPLCSAIKDRPDPATPIISGIFLIDLSTFTLKSGWNVKNYTQDISGLVATGYPEIVDQVFILNAPSYFTMMWGIMRKWVDPDTAEKFQIPTTSEALATLSKYIEPENIPRRFGGKFDWDHGMPLDIDAEIRGALTWRGEHKLPQGPIKWLMDERARIVAVAVGSIDGTARMERVAVREDGVQEAAKKIEPETTQSIEVVV
ncbi:CRAL-TRIO domain-containing protein [Aspergillus granulosus]|uniref:CRAL-TRIO domain-containing protein n=1 Tax=Aspergillus granulosus TaxID=176169 RepID=A0ABR4H0B3_9EURO